MINNPISFLFVLLLWFVFIISCGLQLGFLMGLIPFYIWVLCLPIDKFPYQMQEPQGHYIIDFSGYKEKDKNG